METNDVEKKDKVSELVSDSKYMDWIIEFTADKNGFTNKPGKSAKKKDKDMAQLLPLFYQGIERYADSNYIGPTLCEFGNYYGLKFNDHCFKLGMTPGEKLAFFCIKVTDNTETEFIDFNDILSNKKTSWAHFIDYSLADITDSIVVAYQDGIPVKEIKKAVNEAIDEIITGKHDLPKTLEKEKED